MGQDLYGVSDLPGFYGSVWWRSVLVSLNHLEKEEFWSLTCSGRQRGGRGGWKPHQRLAFKALHSPLAQSTHHEKTPAFGVARSCRGKILASPHLEFAKIEKMFGCWTAKNDNCSLHSFLTYDYELHSSRSFNHIMSSLYG